MTKIVKALRTSPLFYVFLILFCISLFYSKLSLIQNNRNREKVQLNNLQGEVCKLSWNGEEDFVFFCADEEGNKYRILIKGMYMNDKERETLLERGFAKIGSIKVIKPEISGNKGEFNYAEYLKSKKIDYYVYVAQGKLQVDDTEKAHSVNFYSSKMREIIAKSLYKYFEDEFASVILAVMTGDTGLMDEENKKSISLSGFSHLVAVSGAHLAFFSKPFAIVLKRTLLSSGKRKAILLLPVFFIWFMAGGSPSVTRAMIMTTVATVGILIKKPSSMLNSLGIAGLIQILVNPYSCLDTGFILSYGASVSIAVIMPKLINKFKTTNFLINMILPGLAVNLGILPISLTFFGSFSICGFLLNAFAGEIAGILCVGGYLVVLFDRFLSFLPVEQGTTILTSVAYIFEKIAGFVSNGDSWFFRIYVPLIPVILICVYYLVLFLFFMKRKSKVIIGLISVLVVVFIYGQITTKITVSFFDVGQGSCQLIKTSDGIVGLVDTGNGDKDLVNLLKKEDVDNLDFIIITHGHDDHYGGLSDILESINVERIFVPSNKYDDFCNELLNRKDISVTKIEGFASYNLGKYAKMHMYESKFDYGDLNNGSIFTVIKGEWGSFILPGDSESEFMEELLDEKVELDCDLYLAAHHGSNSSVNEKFLWDVSPKYAIISVGYENSYGHPSEEFLNELKELNVDTKNIYRTDRDGEIVVKFGTGIFGKDFVRVWQKKWRMV